ncbi:hypothetical protein BDQ17DRAFT_1248298 [Cyathus striatus]|nr:hypothetical protein BDQ17DRAFT_1248298 [Cyathus striatus]
MITFYDLALNVPLQTGSVHCWKGRFALNYKGVPYQTKLLEYPEVEGYYKEHGIPPSSTKPDGTPFYTLPAIYDDATGAKITDSMKIAEYLDKAYPSGKPDIIPRGTEVMHHAFEDIFTSTLSPLWPLFLGHVPDKLNPPSAEYFNRTRAHVFGVSDLKDLFPRGEEAFNAQLKKVEEALGKIDGWYKAAGDKPFIGGNTPIFADFIVGSLLISFKCTLGDDSTEWKAMRTWHGGRWEKVIENLKEYSTVN